MRSSIKVSFLLTASMVAVCLSMWWLLQEPRALLAQGACTPDYRQTGRQPFPTEISGYIERVAVNRLTAAQVPTMQPVNRGVPPTVVPVAPYVPCILIKAIAAVETGKSPTSPTFDGWK